MRLVARNAANNVPGGLELTRAGRAILVLRLIRLRNGRGRVMHLLTSVLEGKRLSDRCAGEMYARRWGVGLLFRSLKQTSRHWPQQKRQSPPGLPKARKATRAEVKLAQQLRSLRHAA